MPSETAQTGKPLLRSGLSPSILPALMPHPNRCRPANEKPEVRNTSGLDGSVVPGSGHLHRNGVAGMAQFAVGAHVEHMGFEVGQLGFAVVRIGTDDQAMTDAGLVGGGAIDRDDPGASPRMA